MAVNINTVYQRVLAIANKEQRGYITPQEFNLFANQAQMSIFEQYFYDINQFDRLPGNEHPYSDMTTLLEEKISIFKKRNQPVTIINQYGDGVLPTDIYRLGTVLRFSLPNVSGSTMAEIEEISPEDYMYYSSSPLAAPSKYRPVYIRNSATEIKIYPYSTSINTGLNLSAVQYFQQTGENQYNGQNNQFNAAGFAVTPAVTQATGGSVNVYMPAVAGNPSAPIGQIKVGQVVTGTNIATLPATTVKNYIAGASTTLGGAVSTGDKTFTVVAPGSTAGTIAVGQYINLGAFPAGTTVVGVQGNLVTASAAATGNAANGNAVTFLAHLTLSQLPSAALTSSNALTFNEAESLSYIEPGQAVTGSGVPANTTVSAVNGSVVTLSNDLTNGAFVTLTFISDDIKCDYIRRPVDVDWGYNTVNSTALYNSSISTNFELHESEETNLVVKILGIAGIAIKDPSLYQIATAEENRTTQQEKL